MSIETVLYVESKTDWLLVCFLLIALTNNFIFLGPQFPSWWNKEVLDFRIPLIFNIVGSVTNRNIHSLLIHQVFAEHILFAKPCVSAESIHLNKTVCALEKLAVERRPASK